MNRDRIQLSFLDLIWKYKISLAFYIVGISLVTFIILYAFGGVPDELKVLDDSQLTQAAATLAGSPGSSTSSNHSTQNQQNNSGELPVRIVISKINIDDVVLNPATSDDITLNNNLLKGAVRYPGSGTLAHGNVFLFGHSTGIRIVNNQAYKTFNHINYLNPGDTIKVYSENRVYTYSVTSVLLVDSDAALVDLSSTKNMLTLSTCDVFGQKQQRYVVEADYISSSQL